MHTLSVLYALFIAAIATHIHQFVILTPNQDIHMDAFISIMNNSNLVTINKYENQWEVITQSNEWFMKLHLDSLWGFDEYSHSKINIIFHSPTVAGQTTFTDIIAGITVPGSNKYIMLDLNWNGSNLIVPACDVSNDPITFMNTMNTDHIHHIMFKNISKNGIEMQPVSKGQSISFPLTISLLNYPGYSHKNGHSFVQYTCNGLNLVQSCGFEPFDTGKGLDVYFGLGMGSIVSIQRKLKLKSFTIQYTVEPIDWTTSTPTLYNNISETETPNLWNQYLGVWIVAMSVLLACIVIIIILYCSRYDTAKNKTIEKDGNVTDHEQIRFEKQSLMSPTDIKAQKTMVASLSSTGIERYETSDLSD